MLFKLRSPIVILLTGFSLSLIPFRALPESFKGKVIHVADGDTVTLLAEKRQIKIRLAGIDAPEKAQPFGNRSKQNMERMTKGKEALADCPKTDRYGRKVCKVWVKPQDCPTCGNALDVGLAQISSGLAWWYRAYSKEQTAKDQALYEQAESDARLHKRGLWSEDQPIPPWEWRHLKRG